ncbi:MAG: hypothetical protein HYY40_10870 [Bacteroidetes bacterium]|nr:hypothetical protein [Bacteroidota bacterium]
MSVLLLACSQAVTTGQEKERELIKKNKIQSITEYVIFTHLGIEDKEYINHVRLFNREGLLIKETIFLKEGRMDFFAIHEYDRNNNLILTTAMKPDSSFFYKETLSYDGNHNMTEKVYFEQPNGPYFYKNTAVYDSRRRMQEYFWWWPTGLKAINTFTYDGMKMREKMECDPMGKFLYKWVFKYNEKENLTEAVQYYPDSILNSKITYKYDLFNRLTKQINYTRGSIQKTATFEYDRKNLLTSKTEYSSAGRVSAKFRYLYEFF